MTILSVVLGYKLQLYGMQPIQMGKTRPTGLNSEAKVALDHQIQNFLSRDTVESHYESIEFIHPVFRTERGFGVSE